MVTGRRETINWLMCENTLQVDTSREHPSKEALSPEELGEVLAEATETTAEEIERGAEELEIASPTESAVIDE